MKRTETVYIALLAGLVCGIFGGIVALLSHATPTNALITAGMVFVAAAIFMLAKTLWGRMAGFGLMGAAFGWSISGPWGLVGGLIGGICYALTLRFLPGFWGNALGLFLWAAIPIGLNSQTWQGLLNAVLVGLLFAGFYTGGLWIAKRIASRQQK